MPAGAGVGFEWERRGGVELCRARALAEAGPVLAAVTSRRGGVSTEPYAGLNLGLGVGDDPSRVRRNRALLAGSLGVAPGRMVSAPQVHGDGVAVVGPAGPAAALVTARPGVFLLGYFADCVPVFLYDPQAAVAALVHAGWRGTVLRTPARALEVMGLRFGADPGRVWAALGPAIGPCCYRVGEEVMGPLRRAFPGWERLAGGPRGGPTRGAASGAWALDLVEANRVCLEEAGVDPARIFWSGLCTCCRPELFYSHRRDRGRTGRMAALIGLLQPAEAGRGPRARPAVDPGRPGKGAAEN